MGITLFDNFAIIAHSQHENQCNDTLSKWLILTPYIQYISLLLPAHGWNLWNYKDGYLGFFQRASSYSTITPFFEFQSYFNYYPFTIFSLIMMLLLILYLSSVPLKNSGSLSSILLFAIYTLQIPCFKFYCLQIIQADQSEQILILNITTLILYCGLVFSGEVFFRQYSFIPFHPMQQKFTKFRIALVFMNLIIIVLELDNQSRLQQIIALSLIHLVFVSKMISHLYYKPDSPLRNLSHFKMSLVLEVLTILISINVMTNNTFLNEKTISIYMLFISSLCYALGEPLFSFLLWFNQDIVQKQLYEIYELYFYTNNITSNSISFAHLQIHRIINDQSYDSFSHIKRSNNSKIINFSLQSYQKLGLSLIQEVFLSMKNALQNNYEELYLLYISFLVQVKNKPLTAYVELKKYSYAKIQKPIYFKFIEKQINCYLQEKIKLIQEQYQKNLNLKDDIDSPNTQDIYNFFQLQEEFITNVLQVAELKIAGWEFQIKGSKSIYEYERQLTPLSEKIIENINYFRKNNILLWKKNFIQKCDNILTLKLAAVFNSVIMNDYFGSLACESKIQELMKQEITAQLNIIKKTSVIQDQTILISVSVVKQFGSIVSNNKNLSANYFNYNLEEFKQINNINQLMPSFFGRYHNLLIENYVKTAQSSLQFERRLTFSLNQQGFLIPQYLNLFVNFDLQDDFTLMGCLTKINSVTNYLLFDEFGKILGISEHLGRILIPQRNLDFFLDNTHLFYIYMFIPHIHSHMENILTNPENQVQQKQVLIYIYENLCEVQKNHIDIMLNYQLPSQTERTKLFTNTLNDVENLLTNAPNSQRFASIIENPTKQTTNVRENDMIDYLNSLEVLMMIIQVLQKINYFCTAKIQLASFGHKEYKVNYFILELSDFVGKTYDEEKKQKKQDIQQWKEVKRSSKVRSSFQHQSQQTYNYQEQNLLSPSGSGFQRKSLLDKPLQNQLLNYINDRLSNIVDGFQKDRSESFSEEQLSYDVYDMMNKQEEYKSNQGAKLIKSQSSNRSGNSGVAAVEIVNKFTKQTSFIQSLTFITLIKCLAFVMFFILIFVNLAQIENFNQEAQSYIYNINLPVNLNKDFLNVFHFAWIYGLHKLQLIEYSKFIENQMGLQFLRIQSTFQNLTQMYGPFIRLEEQGFLENLQIQTLESTETVTVDYTYYINYLETIGYQLMYAPSTAAYLTNLLKFRFNFDNILRNNGQVIRSLNQLFQSQQSETSYTLFEIVLIEVIIVNVILIIQIFFWFKIEQYCQKVLLLTCRLSEQAASEQILKFRVVSAVLRQEFGEQSWKQQNSHNLCYTNYSKYDKYKSRQSKIITTNEKIIKQFVSKISQKPSKSLPLNARIQQTKIYFNSKIVFVLITQILVSLYIIGDYLLFEAQSNQLQPTQDLIMNYIQFLTNFDNSVGTACIVKSEQQVYSYMNLLIPERADIIAAYLEIDNTANIISMIYNRSTNNSDLSDIYQGVIDSDVINGEDENYCLMLYDDDFCSTFSEVIPFCQNNLTTQEFISLYGQYDEKDNNSEYLNRGIIGIVSNFRTFLQQYFEYEYSNSLLNPNITLLQTQMASRQFHNIVIQHYLNTYLGLEAFFNKVQSSIIISLENNMFTFKVFQYILGFSLTIFFILLTYYIVQKVNLRLIHLRLLITQLPFEIILHIHTISLLKILK